MRLFGRVPITDQDRQLMTLGFYEAMGPAIEAYAPYIEGDLRRDMDTRALTEALRDGGPSAVADPTVRAALEGLMPIYEQTLWPSHKAQSESLKAQLRPLLEAHEAEMRQRLSDQLEQPWSDDPIRVDLLAYANWAGAYTANEPNHITLSSLDADVRRYAFEILFHEAMHSDPLGARLYDQVNEPLAETGINAGRFWHNVLFYISGRAAKATLGLEGYELYINGVGLTDSEIFQLQIDAIEDGWTQGDDLTSRIQASVDSFSERFNAWKAEREAAKTEPAED